MRIITCASFYGTGSSAITDFFGEFDDVFSLGDYEYRFLHEPDGVSDLEYNIVENNHRHNTSDSIKRFKNYTIMLEKYGYGGYNVFGKGGFQSITDKYICEITQLKTHTWWNKDRIDKGSFFIFFDRVYSLLKRIMTNNIHTEKRFSLLQNREWGYYTAISSEEFLKATRKYVNELISIANKGNKQFVMVDQMVPPSNIKRYVRYFDDVKVIVVDRDPRDIYLLEKERWQWGIIPVQNVKEFVQWFKITRKYCDVNVAEKNVLKIRFEDLIYSYETMRNQLIDFVGVDESKHTQKMMRFNPEISKKNVNLKTVIEGYEEDINYIEANLKEFLYEFPIEK